MRSVLAAAFLGTLLAPLAAGQESKAEASRKFQLYDACRPVTLAIEDLNEDAAKMRLTKKSLRLAAESRLRAARLYADAPVTATSRSWLYVQVHVVGRGFQTAVAFLKAVTDRFGRMNLATTWRTSSTGTHGGDQSYIISGVSQDLDKFLAEYLRVNAEDCGGPAL